MKIVGVNGSPRRVWNSAKLLEAALEGAKAQGAKCRRVDLFELDFSGCRSCFQCKLLGGASFGRCGLKDELREVLDEILAADGLVMAAPIYFGDVPGAVRSFWERVWFPGLLYAADGRIAYTHRLKVGLLYTMGRKEDDGYRELIAGHQRNCEKFLGETRVVTSMDAYQFYDYSKYASECFDAAAKRERYEKEFPKDLARARLVGEWMAGNEKKTLG